ncbi:N-acetyl sugar amidotransferase [Pontibacter sp. E15-1]|uniref:N-acetyl sugar amidotransferase n=1 Tax=Pontibacter sp. E15-1 TaxID=2919918 RepID=UPI001F4FCC18|nr:N-acetyl sugar amidotransferase [Pontibacter sp. E15-1]MCJ8166404.1 N-acetyl sugar amidotransferase [Pontibacter sp. E15-1]
MKRAYQICIRCIMDTSDAAIQFDDEGVCNHCHEFDAMAKVLYYTDEEKKAKLQKLVAEIKEAGKSKDYDCIIGLSGGVDSSYLAYCAKELGLRPLGVHLDNGWNSELAVKNIENIVKKLDIDLYTYVVDWEEFKDIQLAYLKASVVDIEVVTDNAIFVILDRIAKEHKVSYFLSGTNFATENVMPQSWFYVNKIDSRNINAIYKKYGSFKKLSSYPMFSTFEYWRYSYFNKVKTVPLLNYLPYNKSEAMEFLKEKLNWRDYGGKHWESKFTQFYQVYILPFKFGIDKRRAHISSLVLTNQLSREEGLMEMSKELYDQGKLNDDIEYMLKKFDISRDEFDKIMSQQPIPHSHYPSFSAIKSKLSKAKHAFLGKK